MVLCNSKTFLHASFMMNYTRQVSVTSEPENKPSPSWAASLFPVRACFNSVASQLMLTEVSSTQLLEFYQKRFTHTQLFSFVGSLRIPTHVLFTAGSPFRNWLDGTPLQRNWATHIKPEPKSTMSELLFLHSLLRPDEKSVVNQRYQTPLNVSFQCACPEQIVSSSKTLLLGFCCDTVKMYLDLSATATTLQL